MTFPPEITTRIVSFGGAATTEAGIPLRLTAATRAVRPDPEHPQVLLPAALTSLATGFRLEPLVHETSSPVDGEDLWFELPVTTMTNMLDTRSRQAIVLGPDEHTHLYETTVTVWVLTGGTDDEPVFTQVGSPYVIGPYPVPAGAGILDGDTMLIGDPTTGALVAIPEVWAEIIADASAIVSLRGEAGGIAPLDGGARVPQVNLPVHLTPEALSSEIVHLAVGVRTSDGYSLPEGTMVVLTIDKTLAEVTANPVADIDDITFEEV